jgi:hypothetical protein
VIKGRRGHVTKSARPHDQVTEGPLDQKTAGPREQGMEGPRDQGMAGPRDQGTGGPRDQGTAGLRDHGCRKVMRRRNGRATGKGMATWPKDESITYGRDYSHMTEGRAGPCDRGTEGGGAKLTGT